MTYWPSPFGSFYFNLRLICYNVNRHLKKYPFASPLWAIEQKWDAVLVERAIEAAAIKTTYTILIAAEERLRRQFTLIFNEHKYIIMEAESDEQVLILARGSRPDLILLADNNSHLDSFKTCRTLQAVEEVSKVPVVLLVHSEDESLINRALESGASDYISYPIKASVMRQRVHFLLRMWAMQMDLQEKEERYRIISSSISDYAYAYSLNDEGRLEREWVTQAFENITGYSSLEIDLINDLSRLIVPEDQPIALSRLSRLMAGEKVVSEFRLRTRTGEIRWLQDTATPIWDETERRVVRIYGAAQDITQRKSAEEMMRKTTLQLQARNEELDAFAHTVAHNLKNPIAGMMGAASVALNYFGRMTEAEIKDSFQTIIEGTYNARNIIDSILLLAGVNRQTSVEISPLDMRGIIQHVETRFHPQIAERAAHIIVADGLPQAVGYAPWIEEVWANYLSNALKYGGNPPEIMFGGAPVGRGMVRFWISDNGKGLTEHEQSMIFTPFTRISQAKIEGHGLGLSVVQRIVQRLGGAAGVESRPGEGARFWFTLPEHAS